MHVRNGFVAYCYLATMLLEFVDRGKISLADKLSEYLPDLPEANAVTIKMLANSTSGYADYVYQPAVLNGIYADPFRQWSTPELIKIGTSAAPTFPPGTSWAYSHTNFAILGTVLAQVGVKPLSKLMNQYIFEPMGLTQTQSFDTPQIPEPVLHTFSSERREALGIPAGTSFYEESTFWNPSWTAAQGAVQTTDIADLTTSIDAIGSGKLLSPESHRLQVDPALVGIGQNTAAHSFGLGVILQGPWITGNKFYAGSGAIVGYLPVKELAIAVITTYQQAAFDSSGDVTDAGPAIMSALAEALAPADLSGARSRRRLAGPGLFAGTDARTRHPRLAGPESSSWIVTARPRTVTIHQRKRWLVKGFGWVFWGFGPDLGFLLGLGCCGVRVVLRGHAGGPRRGGLRCGWAGPGVSGSVPSLRSSSGLGRGRRPAPTAFNRAGGKVPGTGEGCPWFGPGSLPPTHVRARPPCPAGGWPGARSPGRSGVICAGQAASGRSRG